MRGGRTEGVSKDVLSNFLSHSTEKLGVGTFLYFTKFVVSKNLMDKRLGRKQGGVSRYSVKNFLSHSTEKLRREHFYFIQFFWYRNTLWIPGGE